MNSKRLTDYLISDFRKISEHSQYTKSTYFYITITNRKNFKF